MNDVLVVGDIHGDLNQLMYPLIDFFNHDCKKIVFLGDYIDRGESNLYIYIIIKWLMSLKKYKDRIIFIRGNHESYRQTVFDHYRKINENKFDSTFVYDSIHELKFNLVHYDEKLNILFSHSPLSRPIEEVMEMKDNEKDNIENTFTNDVENKTMTYKNIHGHIHYMSRESVIDNFFHGDGKMISIDCDASYGIRLVNNYLNISKSKLMSNVKYLKIINDGKDYVIIEKRVEFYGNANYNLKCFDVLKNELKKMTGEEMNFNEVIKVFENEFKKEFGIKPSKNNIIQCLTERWNKNINLKSGVCIYFNDIPIDVYKYYNLFINETQNEIGKTYLSIVGQNRLWWDMYMVGMKRKDKKSMIDKLKTIVFIICLLIIIISSLVVAYNLIHNQKEMSNQIISS